MARLSLPHFLRCAGVLREGPSPERRRDPEKAQRDGEAPTGHLPVTAGCDPAGATHPFPPQLCPTEPQSHCALERGSFPSSSPSLQQQTPKCQHWAHTQVPPGVAEHPTNPNRTSYKPQQNILQPPAEHPTNPSRTPYKILQPPAESPTNPSRVSGCYQRLWDITPCTPSSRGPAGGRNILATAPDMRDW